MVQWLITLFRCDLEHLKTLGIPRSPQWRIIRKIWLDSHPCCAVCGSKENVVPHHIVPFHCDPSRELDLDNLITLCESKSFNCHLFFGHLKHWTKSNPTVVQDAEYWHSKFVPQESIIFTKDQLKIFEP